ncbi:hypothetical protein [Aquitalea palustris]|uniref:hypothetical protein n=1 Tax=Aquitalea palustris TaxID=2480983 RepID=UPI001CEFBD6F|nr:hypothetical protein [Aquitalea palustris]
MRKNLLLLLIPAALVGCADLNTSLQGMNDNLKSINNSLNGMRTTNIQVVTSRGLQTTISVDTPAAVCNTTAFKDGAKASYVRSWNDLIRSRAMMWHLKAQSGGGNIAKANDRLYANKSFSTTGLPLESNYQLQVGANANNCNYDSFTKGKNAGMDAASRDYNAILQSENSQ